MPLSFSCLCNSCRSPHTLLRVAKEICSSLEACIDIEAKVDDDEAVVSGAVEAGVTNIVEDEDDEDEEELLVLVGVDSRGEKAEVKTCR